MDCTHESCWFDRTICPEPCGSMHSYCDDCGQRMGRCPAEDAARDSRRDDLRAAFVAGATWGVVKPNRRVLTLAEAEAERRYP